MNTTPGYDVNIYDNELFGDGEPGVVAAVYRLYDSKWGVQTDTGHVVASCKLEVPEGTDLPEDQWYYIEGLPDWAYDQVVALIDKE